MTNIVAILNDLIVISVLFIHGLDGHAFESFKEIGGEYMWLRDSLPHDLSRRRRSSMARVMIYGYDSSILQSGSMQNLEDLAASFHSSLLALAGLNIKPILIIAHSLGGLITCIKQVPRPPGRETPR